jgi:hypothetical protein
VNSSLLICIPAIRLAAFKKASVWAVKKALSGSLKQGQACSAGAFGRIGDAYLLIPGIALYCTALSYPPHFWRES